MERYSPVENATILSKVFYFWLNPALSKARKSPLTPEDIYDRPSEEGSALVTSNLEKAWNNEKDKKKPSLFKAIFKSQALMLLYSAITIGLEILGLNQKAITETTAGQIINILSSDAQRFELSFMFIHYGWVGPLQALAVFWLMGEITLYPTLCAAAVMVFFTPMQSLMNRTCAKLKIRIARITDARIRILSDLINGIKILKVHAWESLFSTMVHEVRSQETRLFLFVRLCQAFQFTQLVYQVKVTTMAMLLAIVLFHTGPDDPPVLRTSSLFTLLNYLNSLFLSLTLFLPVCIQYLFDTSVSCTRIQKFLLIPELEGDHLPTVVESKTPSVQMLNMTAYWEDMDTRPTLRNISLEFTGPRLIAVIGSVGSGKSSLLQAILGELPYASGQITRSGSISYMPQLSWIFPGTIRQNVLGSHPFDAQRYAVVLKATTLDVDLTRLANGDRTQVGERGVSLSGGQKARIGLARVAYEQSDFVLLDDPLAAVDAHVSNHLFTECICGHLSNRLRILVTHQHHLLPKMDKIIIMKEGCVSSMGTFEDLVESGIDFHNLTQYDDEDVLAGLVEPILSSDSKPIANDVTKTNHHNSNVHQTQKAISLPAELETSFLPNHHVHGSTRRRGNRDFVEFHPIDELQSDENISTSVSPGLDTRLFSSSEFHDSRFKHHHHPADQRRSTRSIRKGTTPRGSVTSRLAFSMENALSPGILETFNALGFEEDDDETTEIELNARKRMEIVLTAMLEEDNEEDTAEAELWKRGTVSWRYYFILGRIGGGIFGFVSTLMLFALTHACYAVCDVWLTKWSTIVNDRYLANGTNYSIANSQELIMWDMNSNRFNLLVYCVLSAVLVLLSSIRSLCFFTMMINAAKRLHDGMLRSCLATRIRFFEINPSGRILNRFAKDIAQLDDYLPTTIHDFLQCFFVVLGTGIVTVVSSYWVLVPTIPLLVLFYITRMHYLCTSRDLKRIESVARSPMFSWVNVTIQGLPCIRASGSQTYEINMFNDLVDTHTSVFYMNIAAARWLSIRLDLLCFAFIAAVAIICLLLGTFSSVASAEVGLMITYATTLVGLFQWCVRQSAEMENQMVSVERTVEYMELEPEITQPPVLDPPEGWPQRGGIHFDNLWLRYHETAPWALKEAQLNIYAGQKVGIVGRTGAGKSSLISAIFRLVECERGKLLVDGVDIAHLKLASLRKRISIIPQDPIMFAGTIRSNLNPDGNLDDSVMWNALNSVQLNRAIASLPGGLDAPITEGGMNFSTGQRQLLALARAILGDNRILVVDEATANVDPGTDAIIQRTLRNQFGACTVLTVAHRLHTVIDNDVIVVMESGQIVETGFPHVLLNPELAQQDKSHISGESDGSKLHKESQDEGADPVTGTGALASLVRQMGPEESRLLAELAREAYVKIIQHQRATTAL